MEDKKQSEEKTTITEKILEYLILKHPIKTAILVLSCAGFLVSVLYKDHKITKEYEKKTYKEIIQMEQESSLLEKELLQSAIDKDRIVDVYDLRTILDTLGYKEPIDNNTNIKIYNPNQKIEIIKGIFKKEYNRNDIYEFGYTIYIPVDSVRKFLKNKIK